MIPCDRCYWSPAFLAQWANDLYAFFPLFGLELLGFLGLPPNFSSFAAQVCTIRTVGFSRDLGLPCLVLIFGNGCNLLQVGQWFSAWARPALSIFDIPLDRPAAVFICLWPACLS